MSGTRTVEGFKTNGVSDLDDDPATENGEEEEREVSLKANEKALGDPQRPSVGTESRS